MSNAIAEQAAAMSARCNPAQRSSHIAPCEHTLRIGFFFDGFGRHRIKDMQAGRVSNIAKLFLAHKFAPTKPASESTFLI